MQKKKLLIVVHHLTIGGIQKSLISALNAIDYNKYAVTVYVRKNRTDLLEYINKNAEIIINTDKTKYYRKLSSIIYLFLIFIYSLFSIKEKKIRTENKLNEKIRKMQEEYEYRHYLRDRAFDIAVAYSQGYTPELVDKYVNADKKIAFFHSSTQEQNELYNSISERFDAFGVLNEGQKELVEKWYPATVGKTVIVENYVDSRFILKLSKDIKIDKSDGRFVLCSCGRFAKVKGFDLACLSAKILKDNGIDFLWLFVGDGPEMANIKKIVNKYGLESNIKFVGMLKNPYPYVAACDIYIQPSYEEAYGLSIKEALILNRLVVTTDTLGGRTLIKNEINGVICSANGASIADGITKLLTDTKLRNRIYCNIKKDDRSFEEDEYKEHWSRLLEC